MNYLDDLFRQSRDIRPNADLADRVIHDISRKSSRRSLRHLIIYFGLGSSAIAMAVFVSTMITQVSGSTMIDLFALGVSNVSDHGLAGVADVTLAIAEVLPIEAMVFSMLSIFIFLVLLRAALGILGRGHHEYMIRAT